MFPPKSTVQNCCDIWEVYPTFPRHMARTRLHSVHCPVLCFLNKRWTCPLLSKCITDWGENICGACYSPLFSAATGIRCLVPCQCAYNKDCPQYSMWSLTQSQEAVSECDYLYLVIIIITALITCQYLVIIISTALISCQYLVIIISTAMITCQYLAIIITCQYPVIIITCQYRVIIITTAR